MKYIACLLFILVASASLHAEDRTVSCRFLFFGKQNGGPTAFVMSQAGKVSCPIPFVNFSRPLDCVVNTGKIELFDGKNNLIMSPSVGADAKKVFVLVVQTSSDPEPAWRAIVVDDNQKNFPAGGAYVVNLNNGNIRFIIGEHKGMLKKGDTYGYKMPEERDDFNMATVKFWINSEDQWQIASETALRFLPRLRYFFICFRDPISGRPDVRTSVLDEFGG